MMHRRGCSENMGRIVKMFRFHEALLDRLSENLEDLQASEWLVIPDSVEVIGDLIGHLQQEFQIEIPLALFMGDAYMAPAMTVQVLREMDAEVWVHPAVVRVDAVKDNNEIDDSSRHWETLSEQTVEANETGKEQESDISCHWETFSEETTLESLEGDNKTQQNVDEKNSTDKLVEDSIEESDDLSENSLEAYLTKNNNRTGRQLFEEEQEEESSTSTLVDSSLETLESLDNSSGQLSTIQEENDMEIPLTSSPINDSPAFINLSMSEISGLGSSTIMNYPSPSGVTTVPATFSDDDSDETIIQDTLSGDSEVMSDDSNIKLSRKRSASDPSEAEDEELRPKSSKIFKASFSGSNEITPVRGERPGTPQLPRISKNLLPFRKFTPYRLSPYNSVDRQKRK